MRVLRLVPGWTIARLAAAVGVLATSLALAPGSAYASATITGGGSGFAGLEIQQWGADVAASPYNLTVNYQSTSSSQGRANFSNASWDFGASDIPYPASEQAEVSSLESGRCKGAQGPACWNYVTVSAGGLGFMYNLQDNSGSQITDLKLNYDEICKIFTGVITAWDDPELVSNNPELASFDSSRNIKVITRADGAGESYVLSEYCIATDPNVWNYFVQQTKNVVYPETNETLIDSQDFYAGNPISFWPPYLAKGQNSVQASGSDGVADTVVSGTDGVDSITYDAAGYALVRSFPVASVENAAGVYTQPNATSVNVALGYATPRGDGTFNLNFAGPDTRAYFPSTYSYILAQSNALDPSKGATLGQFLCYDIGKGQQYAARLLYAPLSSAVISISEAAIAKIPGAPSPSTCTAGAAPPPPPPKVAPPTSGNSNPYTNQVKTPTGGGTGISTPTGGVTRSTGASAVSSGSSLPTAGGTAGGTVPGQAAAVGSATGGSTVAGSLSGGAGNQLSGSTSSGLSGGASSLYQSSGGTGQNFQLASAHGLNNSDALWSVLEGAALCALGLAVASRSKRVRS